MQAPIWPAGSHPRCKCKDELVWSFFHRVKNDELLRMDVKVYESNTNDLAKVNIELVSRPVACPGLLNSQWQTLDWPAKSRCHVSKRAAKRGYEATK
jgi:hypothetical protein